MILVLGATGTTGGAVVRRLAERGLPSRALVRPRPGGPRADGPHTGRPPTDTPHTDGRGRPPRDPAGWSHPLGSPDVEIVVGDAGDPASLRAALRGVTRLYLAMANGPEQRELELGVVRAAAAAGVEHLVKLSAPVVGPDVPVAVGRVHHEVERAIEDAGLGFTFLRPYAFMQNLLRQAPVIRQTGTFAGATGHARLNLVDARDIADVAVAALTGPASARQVHVLTGAEAVSYPEVARRLSLLGQPVRYVDLPPEQLREGLLRAGQPAWLAEHLLEIQAMTVRVPEAPTDTVRQVTGHEPRALNDFLRQTASQFQPGAAAPGWSCHA